jgi:hypothetical protein
VETFKGFCANAGRECCDTVVGGPLRHGKAVVGMAIFWIVAFTLIVWGVTYYIERQKITLETAHQQTTEYLIQEVEHLRKIANVTVPPLSAFG